MRTLVTSVRGFLALGCASAAVADPPTATAVPATTPAPASSDSTIPSVAKATAETTKAEKATTSGAELTHGRATSWSHAMQNGQKLWCREQISTGIRLSRGVQCNTADELEQRMRNGRRLVERQARLRKGLRRLSGSKPALVGLLSTSDAHVSASFVNCT